MGIEKTNWELDLNDMDRNNCSYKVIREEMDNLLCKCKKHEDRCIILGGERFGICQTNLCPHKK